MNTMTANSRLERLTRLGILREPLGYVDGGDVYEYVRCSPAILTDPLGLAAPTTRPDRAFWTDEGNLDLIAIAFAEEDPDGALLRQGSEAYANAKGIAYMSNVPDSNALVKKIIEVSKEKARRQGRPETDKVPIRVLIIGHGNVEDGSGTGSDPNWHPLFNSWVDYYNTLNDPNKSQNEKDQARQKFSQDKMLKELRGYVREMTLSGCEIAMNEYGRQLLDVVAQDLGILMRAFKAETHQGATKDGGVQVVPSPNVKPELKNYGDFVYEKDGGAVKKQ